jgi:deoxyribodipyrimidine photo-lyase
LSLREITQATRERQRHLKTVANPGKWRAALSSFSGRLHWHCHFIQKLEDFPAMERLALHPGCRDMPFVEDGAKRKAWETGTTGLPFVDACMRSLIATGWINFRMRAMLTAVASYHLNLPWQRTGHHLARMFTDYEPGIHWPQIQMQSGLTGINTIRIYNPVKQGHDQDPDGTFVRRWVPELSSVPDEFIHEPWKYSNAHTPIIDHMNAAREARVRVYDARKGSAFKEAADKIQHKHGSRRSGLSPMRRRAKQPDTRQGSLDL